MAHEPTNVYKSLRCARGNIAQDRKDELAGWYKQGDVKCYFMHDIVERLEATEMYLFDNPEEPSKKQAKVVFEIDVDLDMCNLYNQLHGGCMATLIDSCTSVALTLLARHVHTPSSTNVSLDLTTTFHAPVPLGSRIRIVNTTTAMGGRTMTAKAEVYDISRKRLVATGTHIKMPPSRSKL